MSSRFPTRTPARLPGIDGLRAIAITAVVLFHAEPGALPGGFLGVDLFFVISGFLITRGLLAELAVEGRFDLFSFWRRRFRRLFPPMLAMLVAVVVGAAAFWPDEVATLRGDLPAALGYLANWHQILEHRSYFASAGRPSPLQHLWSLAIEEQFYLLWPPLILTATTFHVRRRRAAPEPDRRDAGRVAALALIGAAASTAWMWVLAVRGDVPFGSDSSRLYFGSDTHAAGLFIGAALAALVARRRAAALAPARGWLGLGALAALGWSFVHVSEFSPGLYRGGFAVIAGLSAMLVAGVTCRGSWLAAALEWAPLRYVGERSYAIYLCHWPVIVVTRPELDLGWPAPAVLLTRLLVPLALAEASYRLLEHRSRAVERALARLAVLPRRVVALPVAVAVLVAVTVIPGRSVAATESAAAQSAATENATVGNAATDSAAAGDAARTATTGTSPVGRHSGPAVARDNPDGLAPASPSTDPVPFGSVLAVGDSVLLGAGPDLRAAVAHLTVDAVVGRQARPTLAEVDVTSPLPDAVVIATGNNGVIDPRDLEKTLRLLKNHRVVLVTVDVPRDWQDPNDAVIRAAAKRHPGVVIFDWRALSKGHQAWFYDDGYHLRPAGAIAYARGISAALRATIPVS